MPVTGLRGRQILDGDVTRADVNTSTSGSALITKLIAGTNITITSTGVDAGTGDVTINATGGSSLNGTGFVRMSGTTASYITGTSSQFVKADGSLDSSSYYLSSGGILTGNPIIHPGSNASYGAGVKFRNEGYAHYSIGVKGSNLVIGNTGSDGQSVWPAGTVDLITITTAGNLVTIGTITATSVIRSGGTSSQFLKADGSVDSSTYLTGNQTITLSGDATGSGTTAITVTLANSGVTAGTYRSVTVDAKGRVTGGTNPTTLSGYGITDALSNSTTSTQSGYFGDIFLFDDSTPSHYLAITNSANLTAARTLSINVNDADRTISLSGNLTVSAAATVSGTNTGDQTITLTGDVTGSGTGSFAATLANSGVTAGTYNNVTVNAKGLVTGGSNVSYLTSYTETDTLATVTGRGNTTTTRIGVATSTPINFVTAGNAGTWLGGIQDATTGWSISNNGLGLKADDSTYAGIVLATGNGLLYFGRTQAAGVGTMTSWLEVSSGLVANFKGSRPQFNGSNLALVSELPTVNNGTLTLAVSGTGLSGSASFTANQSGNTTFTVTSNATSANTASAIVARDASGNFSAGAITSTALYGTSYSTLTSGAGTGTAVFDTITTSGNRLYRVIISGNPNAAGSGSYLDWIYGKLIIGGGYDGTNVVNYIEFVQESPMPRTLFGSGGGDLTVDVKFVQSNVEYDSIGIGGTYTVRFKISGYNSTNTGASTTINLLQIG